MTYVYRNLHTRKVVTRTKPAPRLETSKNWVRDAPAEPEPDVEEACRDSEG